ncbi:Rieske (2Fe-2S) protein [Congregibacter variabilis]|uniref:Rieske (2Fe-2S) protein n=1 Tax=Congregibacter variabilis TaxID=3081200 RepID=A0ABZ0I5G8_9GAMM|nr:Rieske (2Fe-2S) protein [Congregibacter sp. IMCC43200]
MAYRQLEKLMNLHDGYRKIVAFQGRQLLLLQENGELHLIDRHCPHAGQVLDQAKVEGELLTCPKHLMQFSTRDGRPSGGACGGLGVYKLAYEGNSVGIEE